MTDHHHHHNHHHRATEADGRWLILDIGAGTQDILIYDPARPVEGSYKLVLPSPSLIAAERIRQAARDGRDVWLFGRLMGGGAMAEAVKDHLAAGFKVLAQTTPALSIHDNLERVKALGVVISEQKPPETTPVACGDVDLRGLGHALDHFGLNLPHRYAAAVQDHGFAPEGSSRDKRFQMWADFLAQGGLLSELAFHLPPPELTRLKAVGEALPGAILADTASAALLGALLDPAALEGRRTGLIVVNVGNGHTVAFLVKNERVKGVYEHHTSLLDRPRLADHLARFPKGELSHEEVKSSNGHGCRVIEPGEYPLVIITGPKRRLAEGLGRLAMVHGDMMLTGCFGLLEAAKLLGALSG